MTIVPSSLEVTNSPVPALESEIVKSKDTSQVTESKLRRLEFSVTAI